MDFFTADLHFDDPGVIPFAKRPFKNVEAMNAAILDAINAKVGEDDRLFVLGDFTIRFKRPKRFLDRIRCREVWLIRGNHDPVGEPGDPGAEGGFARVLDYHEQWYDHQGYRQLVVLCHYPIFEWRGYFKGSWHLYGHVHGRFQDGPGLEDEEGRRMHPRALDVGIDAVGLAPLSYDEVRARISERTKRPAAQA